MDLIRLTVSGILQILLLTLLIFAAISVIFAAILVIGLIFIFIGFPAFLFDTLMRTYPDNGFFLNLGISIGVCLPIYGLIVGLLSDNAKTD